VKDMPTDRSPGPNGFNGSFKKMLLTFKDDFINILNDLYEEKLRLECINTAHITLIPKKAVFHKISTSVLLKFITKLMENRL
jgi:hypothetical protein